MPGSEGIPALRNFRFSNIRVKDCPLLVDATAIHPDKPLDGFTLMNVTGAGTAGVKLANIRNAVIRNVRAPIGIYNVTGKGLEGAARIDGPKLADAVPAPAQPYTLR